MDRRPDHHMAHPVATTPWYRRGSTWAVLVTVTSALSWWVGGW